MPPTLTPSSPVRNPSGRKIEVTIDRKYILLFSLSAKWLLSSSLTICARSLMASRSSMNLWMRLYSSCSTRL